MLKRMKRNWMADIMMVEECESVKPLRKVVWQFILTYYPFLLDLVQIVFLALELSVNTLLDFHIRNRGNKFCFAKIPLTVKEAKKEGFPVQIKGLKWNIKEIL